MKFEKQVKSVYGRSVREDCRGLIQKGFADLSKKNEKTSSVFSLF